MSALAALRALDRTQRHTVAATFLGWTLDAFDYFLLVMVMPAVADAFHVPVSDVAFALLLTLAFRPLGALIFGRLADRHGRRRILMIDVTLYSVLGLACAFAILNAMWYEVHATDEANRLREDSLLPDELG